MLRNCRQRVSMMCHIHMGLVRAASVIQRNQSKANSYQKSTNCGLLYTCHVCGCVMPDRYKGIVIHSGSVLYTQPRIYCTPPSLHTATQHSAGTGNSNIDCERGQLEENIEDILQFMSHNVTDFCSIEANARELVTYLLKREIPKNDIKSVLAKDRKLLMAPLQSWKTTLKSFTDMGFMVDHVLPIMRKIPGAWEGKDMRSLARAIDTLRILGFCDRQIQSMIAQHPGLMDYSHKRLTRQYYRLMSDEFFKASILKSLVLRMPAILTEPIDQIKIKYDYVNEVMGITDEAMGKSDFLCYDFSHIYCRHQFLYRAGKYQKPDKHGCTAVPNPSLRSIVDTNDRDFAEKVAGLTKEEYNTFVQMCDLQMVHGQGTESIDLDEEESDNSDDESVGRESYRK